MFIRLFFFFLAANTGLGLVSHVIGVDLCRSPDNATGCIGYPNIYNSTNQTGTLVGNVQAPTINGTNAFTNNIITGAADIVGFFTNVGQITAYSGTVFIQALSGGFIFNLINAVAGYSFPSELMLGLQAMVGLILVVEIVYVFTGRFGSGGNA